MIDAQINSLNCKLAIDERLLPEKAPNGFPFMYHLRHDEDNWTKPVLLEPFVLVNFFGTVFMSDPVKFNKENYIEIKQFKLENRYIVFKASSMFLKRLLN
jgi:hypothetical protein